MTSDFSMDRCTVLGLPDLPGRAPASAEGDIAGEILDRITRRRPRVAVTYAHMQAARHLAEQIQSGQRTVLFEALADIVGIPVEKLPRRRAWG